MTNYIAFAIPLFLVSIAVEVAVAHARRRRLHRITDAVTDLGCGIVQQALLVFVEASLLAGYAAIWKWGHLVEMPLRHPLTWVFAFVAVDFVYYWWHRWSHEVNLLWAAHVVHHQSEDYNLAVALRQAVLSDLTIWPLHLPLALAGLPVVPFATAKAFNTLYQFWIHTELVGRLGAVDGVLNTPSNHRVHHAVNPRYLDKNYGGILIVWDRLFRTFEPETEPPRYGITKQLGSFNPLWAQVQHFATMAKLAAASPRLGDKLLVWLRSPAWLPAGQAHPRAADEKYDPPVSRATAIYLIVNTLAASLGTFALLLLHERMGWVARIALAAALLLTVATSGAFAERKRWAPAAEAARALAVAATVIAAIAGR